MMIGEVIRENRKKKGLTQEVMATRLGVTAPAVNKWENGNSLPDIMLLAPIARLLDITLDTLLSYQKDLSQEEISQYTISVSEKLKTDDYDSVVIYIKSILSEYPNNSNLTLQLITMLDGWRMMKAIPDSDQYDDFICRSYEQVLESTDEILRNQASDFLFNFYCRKEQYDKAETYLQYSSSQNPDRKRKQALIYSKTDRKEEAYKAYEELLQSSYQFLNLVFSSICGLAVKDQNIEKVHQITDKISALADLFEMGQYQSVSCRLELVALEKDVDATLDVATKLLSSFSSIYDFTKSPLYEHMTFRNYEGAFLDDIKENLLECFRDDETFAYMRDCEAWKELIANC